MLVLPGLLSWSLGARALPEVGDEKGVTGLVSFGAGWLKLDSNTIAGNLLTDLDNDPIGAGDLASSPSSRSTPIPLILNEIRWNIGNRNEIFVGESIEDAVTLDQGSQVGWRKGTDNLGTFQLGVLFYRLVPTELYEDAFLTDTRRAKTNALRYGFRFQWDKILNSPFEWQLTARTINLDRDNNGQSLVIGHPDNPDVLPDSVNLITADQQLLLQRDASEVFTRLSYLIKAGKQHSFRPLIGYTNHDADGNAQSFSAFRGQLTYAYQNPHVLFVANALVGKREFDERNPIYNEYRDSTIAAIDTSLVIPLSLADGNWDFFTNLTWSEEDSAIDFYNQEAFRFVAGLQYRFTM